MRRSSGSRGKRVDAVSSFFGNYDSFCDLAAVGGRFFLVPFTKLVCLSAAVAGLCCSQPVSPTLQKLSNEEEAARFCQELKTRGTPLIEPAPGQAGNSLLTFLYCGGPATRVRLVSNLNALLIQGLVSDFDSLGDFHRLPGTNLQYLTFSVRNDLRIAYQISIDAKPPQLDPWNQHPYLAGTPVAESSVALPDAPEEPWVETPEAGKWEELRIASSALGGEQSAWVYLPSGWSPGNSGLVIGMDVLSFRHILPASRVVEYLAGRREMPPTILVAAPDLAAAGDSRGYDPAVRFLAEELIPAIEKRYRARFRPERTVVCGASRRGMIAAYAAWKRPDRFQRVLSLSGSFYWRPPGETEYEWLPALYAREPRRPIRLYLAAGMLENVVTPGNAGHYLVGTNRHMRDILTARGYDFRYAEFNGVHSTLNWQDQLLPGLRFLLGTGRTGR